MIATTSLKLAQGTWARESDTTAECGERSKVGRILDAYRDACQFGFEWVLPCIRCSARFASPTVRVSQVSNPIPSDRSHLRREIHHAPPGGPKNSRNFFCFFPINGSCTASRADWRVTEDYKTPSDSVCLASATVALWRIAVKWRWRKPCSRA